MSRFLALVCAAGVGSRMQQNIPKQYLQLEYAGEEKAILEISLLKFLGQVDKTLVAVSKDDHLWSKLKISSQPNILTCFGYGQRIHTVYSLLANAMEVCWQNSWQPEDTFVMIHDAARPCITKEDITRIKDSTSKLDNLSKILEKGKINDPIVGGILPINRIVDSVKRVEQELVKENLNRDHLVLAQTPQTFNLLYLYYLLTKIFIYLNESVEKESYYQPYTRYLEKFSALKKLENSKIAENKLLYNKNLEGMPASQIFSSLTDESAVLMYFSD
ncbi:2-C-methyl-D-erythritol 4-phosphate cytidylyltransferase, partial [Psittacicella gerlachiana]